MALVGKPGEADTQTLINTVYPAYLPTKVVAGCAPDDEEDAGLIPLLADRPTRDGRVTAYVCEGYACQNPTTDPEGLARQLGISWRSADRRATFHLPGTCTPEDGNVGKGSARNRPQVSPEARSHKKDPP